MIGDKNIYGDFNVTIDDKNRMIIPAKTGIEYNEEVLIISINNNKFIVSQKVFEEYISRIDNDIRTCKDKLELASLLDLKDYLCGIIIKQATADKQHRILVTDVYEPKGQAKIKGMGRILKLVD